MNKNLLWAVPILLGLALLSLFIGVANMDGLITVESRIPRTLAVMLAGTALAVAGLIMQMVVHNRFVEPTTAGTAQGAALGLVAVLLLAPHFSVMAKMLVAAASAFLSMVGFLLIARRVPATDPLLLPLVGIVYGGILGAVATFFAYQADILQILDNWLSGDFSAVLRGRYELLWLTGAAVALAYYLADRLTIIGMGKQMARALGLPYRRLALLAMLTVSMMTALVVISVGMIPFLGLVMPNLVRQFVGDNLRRTLPWTAWLGAVMTLACDILARLIRYPYEVPVSTLFGVLGAGLFLYLLLGERHEA